MTSSEWYHWYKDAGICPRCKAEKVAHGHSYCLGCLQDRAEAWAAHVRTPEEREKRRAANREHMRGKYRERRERGVCVRCGKPTCPASGLFCLEHYAADKRQAAAKRAGRIPRHEWPDHGMCYRCGGPIAKGKLCGECGAKARESARRASEAALAVRAALGHPWKGTWRTNT